VTIEVLGMVARAALFVGLLAAGCGSSDRPFDRVALIPSTWEIVTVSGTTIDGEAPPVLSIGRSNSARVELDCGEIDLRYISDTDGAALSFGEQRVEAACQASAAGEDVAIRTAISSVDTWRVISDTTIEMLDEGGRALLSLRLTSCDCPHLPPGTGGPTSS
jgi:hypothetical protein